MDDDLPPDFLVEVESQNTLKIVRRCILCVQGDRHDGHYADLRRLVRLEVMEVGVWKVYKEAVNGPEGVHREKSEGIALQGLEPVEPFGVGWDQ